MTKLRDLFTQAVPQSRPLPNTAQVRNSAGGYAWAVDDWTRMNRFLILGSEDGTYTIKPRELTVENGEATLRCIAENGIRAVEMIVAVSKNGRAPKNDPALFALAMAASADDVNTRRAALNALPKVARTGTHLFHFMQFVEGFRGWGRSLRRAIATWYNEMPPAKLAYQVVKYQQRDGWSHRDALRLAHPTAPTEQHDAIYHWVTQGWDAVGDKPHPDLVLRKLWAFETAKRTETLKALIPIIRDYNLPWEAIPTQFLREPAVWDALLPNMPMTAMIRNLARMTANGLIAPQSKAARFVANRLTRDAERLRKARVHPIQVLSALMTYQAGRGTRGKLTWEPVQNVVDALDSAFYASFGNVRSTGKRVLLGLDVSGSMTSGQIAGVPGLTPRVGSAAMSLITAATEKNRTFMAFTDKFVPLRISPRQRLDDVVKKMSGLPFGRTDCAVPMIWARKNRIPVDTFIIYTDNETWFGNVHPSVALQKYRDKMGIPAKLIVVGMVSNGFTIADPNDAGMLDVVGFNTAAPNVMAEFMVQ